MFAWVRRGRNRRVVLGGLLLAGLLGGAAAVRPLWPVGPGVNPANFRKIVLGMPEAEVEKLLGGPPVIHRRLGSLEARAYVDGFPKESPPVSPDSVDSDCSWYDNHGYAIEILCDKQNRVVARLSYSIPTLDRIRLWVSEHWSKTPRARRARVEEVLRSCPNFNEDPRFTLADLVDFVRDRYDIDFRVDPADFGVRDARELFEQSVGLRESANKDLRANLNEMLGKVKATYVVEDGSIRIVPAPPK